MDIEKVSIQAGRDPFQLLTRGTGQINHQVVHEIWIPVSVFQIQSPQVTHVIPLDRDSGLNARRRDPFSASDTWHWSDWSHEVSHNTTIISAATAWLAVD